MTIRDREADWERERSILTRRLIEGEVAFEAERFDWMAQRRLLNARICELQALKTSSEEA